MKHSSRMALLTILVAATASAQDVNVTSTTMAQVWKQDTPGFDKTSYMPATEFLAIDANKLGSDALSLHLYGWGTRDLQEQSMPGGKSSGNLTYGYLQYSFDHANAQLKAGRFTVNQGVGNEQVDGVSGRTDLRGGITVSFFAGKPVIFKNLSNLPQRELDIQRDFIFGARVATRLGKVGELGVSYLQDGSTAAKDLPIPQTLVDYTRKQMGADIKLTPVSFIDFSGRTVFDVAGHYDVVPNPDRPIVAEHDYSTTIKAAENISVTGTFVERNFNAYYAGSTLPSLFNMNEKGMFTATGGNVTWAPVTDLQVVADARRTKRELYGNSTRAGADLRYNFSAKKVLVGAGYHKINAFDVKTVDSLTPAFSVSHSEMRVWAMMEKGKVSVSLDAIRLHYVDADANPALLGKSNESEIVGSLGYQLAQSFKISGDVSFADTPFYKKQVTGLLRAEYRFGFAGKGGK
jgi:hypothetical protein